MADVWRAPEVEGWTFPIGNWESLEVFKPRKSILSPVL